MTGPVLPSERLLGSATPVDAATRLLGASLTCAGVTLRIVEVEAYGGDPGGPWPDPAAHSFRGPTPRNSVMFGPPGRLYVYLSYGMHLCANIVCGPDGTAGAVLIRAGEVVDGLAVARTRRPRAPEFGMARGPGNVGSVLALSLAHNGVRVFAESAEVSVTLSDETASPVQSGPRVGVSTAPDRPWRFWIPSVAVSAYRRSPRAPTDPAGEPGTQA
ncbi:DNA-3-methyladenine glycosylase [Rhodococcus sp. BP-149]|jgi:DNA-3-methyladenine glycosylase|uniref:DNA-3-methyladenine glycosylase n=1 Tax=unclassified Rhodococcus (in: high G+C Gram-positive bacteria) TaxID=192944 RepID=UPI001C9B95A7|nr:MULTISPECIES: DNA-3-methyladenine glycosylase [unclassified Rhodococcus (in: high G+C Gram-positive bacteria)]MBY6683688.1 DNA-3-methyladenine glycosylase [Rhodococcus sp. BP-288]MBY6695197.1 DNA-3-methyladenine glycosylase [Rhodococcus sp. BP-188]MBY6697848.1 DNA-3-methyladenine glycosylase [Rhodococcus sp. BP-285]MBY6702525.1 DNA-3-methyladenine glycosylase [Rhodococcus sp. BP-283]MBY6709542.1 DNA-3-methyladenine glycosylase [Rhodococcus sp. BP-160]